MTSNEHPPKQSIASRTPSMDLSSFKRRFDGSVSALYNLRRFSSVSQVPFAFEDVTAHMKGLGHGWYMLTGTRSGLADGLADETDRVCKIVWAENLNAALLVCHCDDTVSDIRESVNELPPIGEFMPAAGGWTYGEIIKAGQGSVMESAEYDSRGKFRYRMVRLDKAHVYYASRTRKARERPFAISLVLPAS